MTKYLVTGAAGFIGSNLCEQLIDRGHEVIGLDNYLAGKPENLAPFVNQMQFVEGDIRDSGVLSRVMPGVDFVLHHGALASVPWSVAEPALAHDHNVNGTLNVLIAARDAGVKKVVMAVTSAAYGNTEVLPAHEELPIDPLSPYAATKIMGEMYLALFSRVYGLPTVGLRYFNVFGKRQDPKSAYAAAIPIFVQKVLRGEAPVIFGDGEQTRDFVYIDDVVQANLQACEADDRANGQVFNIGTGRRVTVNDIARRIVGLLGAQVELQYAPVREGDVLHSVADISKAASFFGYSPQFDVKSGLEKAIGWYRENLSR